MDYMSQLSVTVSFSNFLHKFMSFREREREREMMMMMMKDMVWVVQNVASVLFSACKDR